MSDQGLELICTTGGLGPTADDLTASIVGEFCGQEMYLDEPTLEKIREIIAQFTRRMNWDADALDAGSRKQAVVPRGSDILGPAGTAPGLVVTPAEGVNKPVVVVLPGPPGELQAIWKEAIETDAFKALVDRTFVFEEQMIRMIGVPESDIAKTLREFDEAHGLGDMEITTCLRKGEMEILVSHRPEERAKRERLIEAFNDQYSGAIFSQSSETVDEQIVRLLDGRKIALAESCTGGLLAQRLTAPAGASGYFNGSAVTYSNEAKVHVLSVPEAQLEEFGAVSPEVAKSMAEGALKVFEADFPVGTVEFHAVSSDGRRRELTFVLPGRRSDIQERSATVALHLLRSLIADPD
jgi:nicotinamide-nucleotide amidase